MESAAIDISGERMSSAADPAPHDPATAANQTGAGIQITQGGESWVPPLASAGKAGYPAGAITATAYIHGHLLF